MEVRPVELHSPDRLVDRVEVGHGERLTAEGGGKPGVLELRPGPLDTVGEDPVVVEGERRLRGRCQCLCHRHPPRLRGVRPRGRLGQVRAQRQPGDGHDPEAGVTAGIAVCRELLEDDVVPSDSGLLVQLTVGSILEVLVDPDEPAGQSHPAGIRLAAPPDEERVELVRAHGQDHQVSRHVEGWVLAAVGHGTTLGSA